MSSAHACGQDLDAAQAYILLRRWASEHPGAAVAQHLGPEHEAELVEAYFLERTYAIKSLELVVQQSRGLQAAFQPFAAKLRALCLWYCSAM